MVNIFLNGCCGRMGKAIAALCENNPDYKIVAGGDIIENSNYGFPVYTSLNECTEDFDVIIDFSNAKAVPVSLSLLLTAISPSSAARQLFQMRQLQAFLKLPRRLLFSSQLI